MEERLAKLEQMAQEGRISRKAYKRARDRARVQLVLDEDAPPRGVK